MERWKEGKRNSKNCRVERNESDVRQSEVRKISKTYFSGRQCEGLRRRAKTKTSVKQ